MIATRNVVTRARVEGLVILTVALAYLWQTRSIPSLYQMPGVPGPAAFPALVGFVFAASGLWRMLMGGGGSEPLGPDEAAGAATPDGAEAGRSQRLRFYAMWAVLLAYLVLMPTLGFPLATVPALAALFGLLGERRVAVAAGLSLASTAVLYLGFALGLGVRLPLGILEPLVK